MSPDTILVTLAGLALTLGLVVPQPHATQHTWPGLHNAHVVRPGLVSGSMPDGDDGWRSLAALGIRTIISVDGLPPDAEGAARIGARPVHLPIGYDGVPRDTALLVARAIRDLPGPVYLHCHHGKHRGPAAAVAAAICLDPSYTAADGRRFLTLAGTDPKYPGLYGVPATFARPGRAELDAAPANFPPLAAVPDLAMRMVEIDGLHDKVKLTGGTPADAVALAELFRESARLPSGRVVESNLAAELDAAAAQAEGLAAPGGVAAVGRACAACHARHRDSPGVR